MEIIYTITEKTSAYSVGDILKKELHLSRRIITKLKKQNGITANGTPVFTNAFLAPGCLLKVSLPENEHSKNLLPENIPIDVLYEDAFLLAVNKPRGLPVHPTRNFKSGTLAGGVMYYYRNEPFVFRAVNRLDKDTSGIVLIAKNQFAAACLSKQWHEKSVQKIYYAITEGVPFPLSGTIQTSISLSPDSIIKRCVSQTGTLAITDYKTIKTYDNGKALAEVYPKTGKTHQIRVHMAHIGCPLYADFLYGNEIIHQTFYLHCHSLSFVHPHTRLPITITAPMPSYFKDTEIEKL